MDEVKPDDLRSPPGARRLSEYSPELLNRLFEAMSDGVVVFDEAGRIATCNAGMALIAGRSIEQLLGSRPEDLGGHTPWCVATASLTSSEGTIIRPDGKERRVLVKGFIVPGTPALRAAVYRDITSQRRRDKARHEAEQQGTHLMENVNDGILVHRDGLIVYVNERLAGMFGYERRELVMQALTVLHAATDPAPLPDAGTSPTRYTTVCRRKDGSLLDVEVAVSRSLHEGREAVFEVVRDVSLRRRAENRAAAFLALGKMLNSASTPKEAARAMLKAAEGLMRYDSCALEVFSQDEENVLVPILYVDTIGGERVEVDGSAISVRAESATHKVLRSGPMLVLRKGPEDIRNSSYNRFGDTSRPSMSLMFVPIRSSGGTLGVLSLQSYEVNAYTNDDLEVLQALADYCSGALDRTRAVGELRESEERYRQMFQGNSAIQLILDPRSGSILDANQAAVDFYGYPGDQLRSMRIQEINNLPSEQISALMNATAERKRGSFAFRHRLASGALRDVEVHSSPITVHGRTLLHSIIHDVTDRNRAIARGHAIADLGHRLSVTTSPVEVGNVVMEVAQKLIGWDAGFIDLLTSELDCSLPRGQLLVPIIHYDTMEGEVQVVTPVYTVVPSGSISERTLREGPQLVLRSPEELKRSDFIPYGNTERRSASLMFVPIHGRGGVIGVMSIQSYRMGAYTKEDLNVLQTLADHCSGALERTRTEEQVRLLESAVRLATDMVVISAVDLSDDNDTRIIFVNDAFVRHTGWAQQEVLGSPSTILHGPLTDPAEVERLRQTLRAGRPVNVEIVNYRKDGSPYDAEFSAFPITDASGKARYFVSVQRDVTERRRTQRQLAWQAFHDPLTQLPNRSLFRERLDHALARRQRTSTDACTVLYLDLDGFKEVNDRFGHSAGDKLLVQVARRLESCVRPGDTVARMGGDEFILLLEGAARIDDVLSVADRILVAIRQPISVGGGEVNIGTSIGIAFPEGEGTDSEDIIRRADEALYRAKAEGKNRYHIAEAVVGSGPADPVAAGDD